MNGIFRTKHTLRSAMHALLALAVTLIVACSNGQSVPTATIQAFTPKNAGKPAIKGLLDLGGQTLAVGDNLPQNTSDARFSPGEWVLIRGKNLSAKNVFIDGTRVPVQFYVGSAPLIRIPTHLSPLKQHELRITTDFGTSKHRFDTSHYIVTTDLDGKETHLVRTNRKADGGVEEEWIKLDTDTRRPMFNLITKDSRHLLLMDVAEHADTPLPGSERTFNIIIQTYDLTAPNMPAKIATYTAKLGSRPLHASINNEGTLLLLGNRSITLIDAGNARDLRTLSHTQLPNNSGGSTTYVDAIFLDNGRKLAALETYKNKVVLFSINGTNDLTQIDSIDLLPNKKLALSVDLEPAPDNPKSFWVLESPNYRLAGSKLSQTYKKLIKRERIPESKKSVHQLQHISIEGDTLQKGKTIATPEGYAAYFSVFGEDGKLYLSTTKTDFLNAEFSSGNTKQVLKNVKNFLWDSIAFGRILAIDTETGETEMAAHGVGIYYHLVDVPDIGPVFSLLKFGPSFSFPYISPSWGLGIKSTGTYAKRKMNKRAIFPPYSIGFVDYQY